MSEAGTPIEGMRTVKGPSGSQARRLLAHEGAGRIVVTVEPPRGGKGQSVELSPAQARDFAEKLLRLVNEDSIASLIPWNVGAIMRAESNARIIALGKKLEAELGAKPGAEARPGRPWWRRFTRR